ncbi:hypothetical protein T11_3961 [Trichinella zimbabwensis]|uniref:Uncharacterized protein n=1 Tax=Trichinella zimbabwensis TaxID=268475 RepID=A0A0V1GD68_9BILA|nr:hypothetical protein T11_3961 [Trichinella zimbabwensis]
MPRMSHAAKGVPQGKTKELLNSSFTWGRVFLYTYAQKLSIVRNC